jgi:hypothetical protein
MDQVPPRSEEGGSLCENAKNAFLLAESEKVKDPSKAAAHYTEASKHFLAAAELVQGNEVIENE